MENRRPRLSAAPRQLRALDAGRRRRIAAVCPGLGKTFRLLAAPIRALGPLYDIRRVAPANPQVALPDSSGGALVGDLGCSLIASGPSCVDAWCKRAPRPDLAMGKCDALSPASEYPRSSPAAGTIALNAPPPAGGLAAQVASGKRFGLCRKPWRCGGPLRGDDGALIPAIGRRDLSVCVILLRRSCRPLMRRGRRWSYAAFGTDLDQTAHFRFQDGWPGNPRPPGDRSLAPGNPHDAAIMDSCGKIPVQATSSNPLPKICAMAPRHRPPISSARTVARVTPPGYPVRRSDSIQQLNFASPAQPWGRVDRCGAQAPVGLKNADLLTSAPLRVQPDQREPGAAPCWPA